MTRNEAARARNEAALERAAADPGAVADAAVRCEALADALRAWPVVGAGDMDRLEEPFTDADAAAADREWADHEARQSGEWRAMLIRDLMHLRAMPADGRAVLRRYGVQYDAATNAGALCGHLVKLARSPEDDSGVSLLVAVVEALPAALDTRHAITITDRRGDGRNLHRVPALADLATLSPVEAVMVDGEPMASGGPEALTTWRRVRPKTGEQRAFAFAGPRSLGGQAVGDVVIRTLASLPRMDMRSPIVGDVARTAALAFALTGYGPIPDSAGAVFVGGRDTLPNRQRWWKACEWLRAMTITINERTGEWVGLANVDPDGAGGVHLGPPAWWRGKGEGQRWRLSGALWRPVRIGGGRGAGGQDEHYSGLARMLAGFEARLCYSPSSGRGKRGRVPDTLRPVRRGGPGPEVWIGWRDAITLAGENVPADATGQGSEGRRYRRRVDALIEAGYKVESHGEAAPVGDTVEIVRVRSGGRHRGEAGLWVRASARFCAAASGRQTWERIPAGRLLGAP